MTVVIHELPRRGQVYLIGSTDEELEVMSVVFGCDVEDGIIVLRPLHESRTEPMMLSDFLAQRPELVVH